MSSAAPKRPTKAAHRYWRGKPDASTSKAAGAGESDEDSELSSDDQGDARGLGRKKLQSEAERAQRQGIQIVQGDLTAETSARPSAQRHAAAPAKVEEVSTGEEEVDGSSEESSSEEEESSEGDEPAKPMFKPVFVSKRQRDPKVLKKAAVASGEAEDQEEAKRQAQLEEERQKSHVLTDHKAHDAWAPEEEAQEKFPDVDDTDGLDPTAEFEAWKLRELQRLKRDEDARNAREAEKEEIEARRAMPEHLRFKDDMAHADATRNRSRGGQAFLSKYHHSGVFYSEDDRTKELMERERRNKVEMEDQVMDMASLPKMMQVRDFGKRSRSKHTHLRDVDTTKQDAGWAKGGGAGGGASTSGSVGNVCFHCEQPGHVKRDCPQLQRQQQEGSSKRDRDIERRQRDDRSKDWGRHDDVHSPPPRRRSRSPPRGTTRRERERSRSRDRDAYGDKRRRYD